jgi:hypothetical protein
LTDAAGLLVIAGKKNASFSPKASSKPFEEVAWSKEAPKDFATVEFSEGGRWTLRDDKFLFVLEIAVLNRSKIVPALDKSLARASVITLPKGTYTLWGYTVTVEKSKGTLIFAHGKLVDTSDVASKTIPPAPTAPQGQPPVDADKYEPADPSELSFSIKDMNYRTGPDGETPTSGNVGHFICEGHELQLAKQEFEDGFIVTKDYGKIKIRFSRSLFSSGFSVWLTAKQKEALKPLKDTIKK